MSNPLERTFRPKANDVYYSKRLLLRVLERVVVVRDGLRSEVDLEVRDRLTEALAPFEDVEVSHVEAD